MSRCDWCAGIETDNPTSLCRPHLAEQEGLSLAELDRMEDEQAAEWREAYGG